MNKRALVGKIILLAALAIAAIIATIYYAGNLQFRKGDITATIAYDPQEESEDGIEIIEIPPGTRSSLPEEPKNEEPEDEQNLTEENLSLGNNNSINASNTSG